MANINGGLHSTGPRFEELSKTPPEPEIGKEKGEEKDLSKLLPNLTQKEAESTETLASLAPSLNEFIQDPMVRWVPSTDSARLQRRDEKGKAKVPDVEPKISREAPLSTHRTASTLTHEVSQRIFEAKQEASPTKSLTDELDRSKAFKLWRSVILRLPKSLAKSALSFSIKNGIVQIKDMDPRLIVRLSPHNIKEVPIPQLRKLSDADLSSLTDTQVFAIGPYRLKELDPERAAFVINHLEDEQAQNFLLKFKEFLDNERYVEKKQNELHYSRKAELKPRISEEYFDKFYEKLDPSFKAHLGIDILIEKEGNPLPEHLLKEVAAQINKGQIDFEEAAAFYKALSLDAKAVLNYYLVGQGKEPKDNLFLHKLRFQRLSELKLLGEETVKGDTAFLVDLFREGAEASQRSQKKETLGDTGIELLRQFKRDIRGSHYTVNGTRVDPEMKTPTDERWYPVLRDIYQSSMLDAKLTQNLQLILHQGAAKEVFDQAADRYGLLAGRQYALAPLIGIKNQALEFDVKIDNKTKEVTIGISVPFSIKDQVEDTLIGKAQGSVTIKISQEDLREGRVENAEVSYSFSPFIEKKVKFTEGFRTVIGKKTPGVESHAIEHMPHKERTYGGAFSFTEEQKMSTDKKAEQEKRLESLKTAFTTEDLTEAALYNLNEWEGYPRRLEYMNKRIENRDTKYADNPNPFEVDKQKREEFQGHPIFVDIIQRCEQKMKDNPELTKGEAFDQVAAEITARANTLIAPEEPALFGHFAHIDRAGKGDNAPAWKSDQAVVRGFIEGLLAPYGDRLTTNDRMSVRRELGVQIANSAATLAQSVTSLLKQWESEGNQQKLQALKGELRQVILEAYEKGETEPSAERLEQLREKYANRDKEGEISEDVFNEVIEEALDRSKNLSSFLARRNFSVKISERAKTDYYEEPGKAEDKLRAENRSRFAAFRDNSSAVQDRRFKKRFGEGIDALFDNALVGLFDTPEPELPTDEKVPGINFFRQAQAYGDFLLDETFQLLDKSKTQ